MTFPTIPTAGANTLLQSSQATATTTHTFPSLTTLDNAAGDLLIAVIVTYQGNSFNGEFSAWGGGFTELIDRSTTTANIQAIGVAYKFSDGTETGTFTVTSLASARSVMFLMSIKGAHPSTPPVSTDKSSGTVAAANPAALNPAAWDVEDTLWIAIGVNGEISLTGTFDGITAAPAGYTGYVDSGIIGGDVVGALEGAVAFRQNAAASEDAAGFTLDITNAGNSAMVLGVRPAPEADPQRIEEQSNASNSVDHTFTLGAGVQVGDLVVLVQMDNFYTLANLLTPTGTGVTTWTEKTDNGLPVDGGTNDMHARVWTGTVTTAGGTVIANRTNDDDEGYATIFVFRNAEFDTCDGTDVDAGSTSFVAPGLTPTSGKTNDYLICVWGSLTGGHINITPPGGMTGGTEWDIGGVCTYRAAYQKLTSDSATGTRTAAASASQQYVAVSVLVKSVTAGGPIAIDGKGTASADLDGTLSVAWALDAKASASADLDGALGLARPLDAAASVAASLSGSLSVAKAIDAKAVAAADLDGDLLVNRGLTSIAPAAADIDGTLRVAWALAGTAIAAADLDGELTVAGLAQLDGKASAAAELDGDLAVAKPLSSTASAAAGFSGTLSVARALTGMAAAAGDGSANLLVARALVANSVAAASAAGNLSVAKGLTGTASSAADLDGSLALSWALAGSTSAAADLTGNLTVQGEVALDGAAPAAADLDGALAVARTLLGSVGTAASATGNLSVAKALTGSTSAAVSASADLPVARALAGVVPVSADLDGSLRVAWALDAKASAAADLDGELTVVTAAIQLDGKAVAAADLDGSLGLALQLAGATGAAAGLSGTLTVTPLVQLTGEAWAAASGSGSLRAAWALSGAASVAAHLGADLGLPVRLTGVAEAAVTVDGWLYIQPLPQLYQIHEAHFTGGPWDGHTHTYDSGLLPVFKIGDYDVEPDITLPPRRDTYLAYFRIGVYELVDYTATTGEYVFAGYE